MKFGTHVEEDVPRTEKYFKRCVSLSLPSYNCLIYWRRSCVLTSAPLRYSRKRLFLVAYL